MTDKKDNIKVEELPNSKISLQIEVSSNDMENFKKEALIKMGKDMAVGGFRKGKAPLDILRDQVDRDKWLLEAVDLAVTQKYYDAVMHYKDKYITITSPKIDFVGKLDQTSLDHGFTFKAEVDVYPEVDLPDYQNMKVDKLENEVTKDEIDQAIADLRNKRSKLNETLEGHKIEKGEWVDIDFTVFVDGQEIKEAGAQHFPLIVGNKTLIPGFEEKLIGLKRKEEKTFKLDIPADFRDQRLAGKEVEFKVNVHEIKKVDLPEYNDDFIKSLKIDKIEKKADFEEYIKNNLQLEKEARNKEEIRNKILEKIVEKTKIDIPQSLIAQELQLMWRELERNLAQRGVGIDDYLAKENMDKEKVEEGWREQAVKRVQISLIIREVIKKEGISVSKDDIDEYISEELSKIKQSLMKSESSENDQLYKKYEEEYAKDENKARVEQQLILDKMFDTLFSHMVK